MVGFRFHDLHAPATGDGDRLVQEFVEGDGLFPQIVGVPLVLGVFADGQQVHRVPVQDQPLGLEHPNCLQQNGNAGGAVLREVKVSRDNGQVVGNTSDGRDRRGRQPDGPQRIHPIGDVPVCCTGKDRRIQRGVGFVPITVRGSL